MAVPKRRHSSTRRDKRRHTNSQIFAPLLGRCSHCGQPALPHRVCKECGYYKGVSVLKKDLDD